MASQDDELRAALAIVADYFPAAVKELARVCKAGNRQHNDDAAVLFWDRSKSSAHFTKGVRHWTRRGERDDDGTRHTGKASWRALADLQIECERDGAPIAPAALRAPMPHGIAAAMVRDGIVSKPPNCDGHHAMEAPMPPHIAERLDGRDDDEGEEFPHGIPVESLGREA
jgi:hypothetical protein